ncbi:hypothetical protein [Halomonas caseinilytica]|uniref:hypothetical protein n=1 Tax=Halomonas caseinilytica TaxID=438744 RepID=UPI0007E5BB40|nr:hypothetical protein [Halomonas caseinilytica]
MEPNLRERRARVIEARRQARAKGKVIKAPEKPIIGCRWTEPKDPANAARAADFSRRWHGQAEPLIQIWR